MYDYIFLSTKTERQYLHFLTTSKHIMLKTMTLINADGLSKRSWINYQSANMCMIRSLFFPMFFEESKKLNCFKETVFAEATFTDHIARPFVITVWVWISFYYQMLLMLVWLIVRLPLLHPFFRISTVVKKRAFEFIFCIY